MRKTLIKLLNYLIFVSICSCQNNGTKIENEDLSVHLSLTRDYYVPYHGKVYFEPITDTLIEKRFDVTLSIRNNSDHQISMWLMSCSWQDNVLINNPYIYFTNIECDGNYPIPHKIKSHDSISFKGTLSRELMFDNSCKNCIGTDNVNVATTKIGFIVIDTVKCKTFEQYHSTIEDKSKWDEIIWSNPLYLNKK